MMMTFLIGNMVSSVRVCLPIKRGGPFVSPIVDSVGGRRDASQVATWSPQAPRPAQTAPLPAHFPGRNAETFGAFPCCHSSSARSAIRQSHRQNSQSFASWRYQEVKYRRESPATGVTPVSRYIFNGWDMAPDNIDSSTRADSGATCEIG